MKHSLKTVFFISGAGMDLCWLQAWAAFLLHSIFNYQVPLLFVFSIYCCGIMANYVCYFKRRMRITVLGIKLLFFSASFSLATYFFLFSYNDHAAPLQLSQLFDVHKPFVDWGLTLFILLIAGITWKRSAIQVLKPLQPENVYLRLDLGIAAFFLLMVLKLMLFGKFGLTFIYPDLKYLFFPFFLFGLLTIGMMLSGDKDNRQYASGFHKIGVVISFASVLLIGGLGMVFLFHSQMMDSADKLSAILKKAGPPLEGAVIWLGGLLSFSKRRYELPPLPTPEDPNSYAALSTGPAETGWLTNVIQWGAIALLSLLLLLFVYLLLRHLIRFLFNSNDPRNIEKFWTFDCPEWLKWIIVFISRNLTRIFVRAKGVNNAAALFTALVSWGRRSGIHYKTTDTPLEFGARLSKSFPGLEAEIKMLIHLLYKEIYGELKLNYNQISDGKMSKKRLAHPRFWKIRMKNWLLSSEK